MPPAPVPPPAPTNVIRSLAIALAAIVVMSVGATVSWAQPAQPSIDVDVAKALLERGKVLFARGENADAKMLFIESIERSGDGPSSADALSFLRSVNERLGIANREDGNPVGVLHGGAVDAPQDPYGDGSDGPKDPYGAGDSDALKDPYGGDAGDDPLDPYAPTAGGAGKPASTTSDTKDGDDKRKVRKRVATWSAAYGALLGLAVAGPQDDNGNTRGGAVLAALAGGGIGAGAAWYVLGKRELTVGQGQALISGGTWGSYIGALFGDAVTGVGTTSTNEGYKSAAIGGALGLGAGVYYALRAKPSEEDIALTNSFGLYGTSAGLLFGVLMDPPEGEAYSINGALGAAGGIGLGMYLSDRVSDESMPSRSRMLRVDLGALAGVAATWALFYPLIADDTTNNDEQAAGLVSIGAMGIGAYVAWRMTRGFDADREANKDTTGGATAKARRRTRQMAALPGVVTRSGDGTWGLGTPMLKPMENPALAPRTGALNLGVDVLSGRF